MGWRYTRRGSQPSYDLCEAEHAKLTPEQQRLFERVSPPITPRRTLFGFGALSAGWIALSAVPPLALAPQRQAYGNYGEGNYEDFLELPPLSPAEALVAMLFKPNVPATQRERRRDD